MCLYVDLIDFLFIPFFSKYLRISDWPDVSPNSEAVLFLFLIMTLASWTMSFAFSNISIRVPPGKYVAYCLLLYALMYGLQVKDGQLSTYI
jgi:hypothetical protein